MDVVDNSVTVEGAGQPFDTVLDLVGQQEMFFALNGAARDELQLGLQLVQIVQHGERGAERIRQ